MGDFTGFTFGDWHSTDPTSGLVTVLRISSGDRYEEELQPEIKDITAEVPGLDGEYFFGSNYGSKKINIDIAFDSLSEEQFRQMRRAFGTRNIKQLIFDERPYKKYMAKIESPVELSYVCFDEPKRNIGTERDGVRRDRENDQDVIESASITDTVIVPAGTQEEPSEVSFTLTHIPNGEVTISPEVEYTHEEETYVYVFSNEGEEPITITLSYSYDEVVDITPAWEKVTPWVYEEGTQRVYKGDGKISFVCYFPFAKSVYKVLPEGSEEWASSSGLLTAAQYSGIDTYTILNPPAEGAEQEEPIINGFRVYNAGDVDTGFRLYIPKSIVEADDITLTYKADQVTTTAALLLKQMTLKTNDIGVLIDTNNQTIVGVSQFNLDVSGNAIYTTTGNLYNEYVDSGYFFHLKPNTYGSTSTIEVTNGSSNIKIFYDYLYF